MAGHNMFQNETTNKVTHVILMINVKAQNFSPGANINNNS